MPQYSQAQLDAMAQQQGFPNYAAWSAYQQNQAQQQEQRRMQSAMPAQQQPQQQAPTNWLQQLMGDWYPLAGPAQKARKAMQGSRR